MDRVAFWKLGWFSMAWWSISVNNYHSRDSSNGPVCHNLFHRDGLSQHGPQSAHLVRDCQLHATTNLISLRPVRGHITGHFDGALNLMEKGRMMVRGRWWRRRGWRCVSKGRRVITADRAFRGGRNVHVKYLQSWRRAPLQWGGCQSTDPPFSFVILRFRLAAATSGHPSPCAQRRRDCPWAVDRPDRRSNADHAPSWRWSLWQRNPWAGLDFQLSTPTASLRPRQHPSWTLRLHSWSHHQTFPMQLESISEVRQSSSSTECQTIGERDVTSLQYPNPKKTFWHS